FLTSSLTRFFEKVRSASAFSTFLLRIIAATRLSLRGLVRIIRLTAIASLLATRRGFFSLPIALPPLRFLVGRMAVIGPRRRILAELHADHLLVHRNRDVLLAVVDAEGEPDELRQDGRPARPDFDDLVATRLARLLRLLQD